MPQEARVLSPARWKEKQRESYLGKAQGRPCRDILAIPSRFDGNKLDDIRLTIRRRSLSFFEISKCRSLVLIAVHCKPVIAGLGYSLGYLAGILGLAPGYIKKNSFHTFKNKIAFF